MPKRKNGSSASLKAETQKQSKKAKQKTKTTKTPPLCTLETFDKSTHMKRLDAIAGLLESNGMCVAVHVDSGNQLLVTSNAINKTNIDTQHLHHIHTTLSRIVDPRFKTQPLDSDLNKILLLSTVEGKLDTKYGKDGIKSRPQIPTHVMRYLIDELFNEMKMNDNRALTEEQLVGFLHTRFTEIIAMDSSAKLVPVSITLNVIRKKMNLLRRVHAFQKEQEIENASILGIGTQKDDQHAELKMLGYLFHSGQIIIPTGRRTFSVNQSRIGVSKKCCPRCRSRLDLFHKKISKLDLPTIHIKGYEEHPVILVSDAHSAVKGGTTSFLDNSDDFLEDIKVWEISSSDDKALLDELEGVWSSEYTSDKFVLKNIVKDLFYEHELTSTQLTMGTLSRKHRSLIEDTLNRMASSKFFHDKKPFDYSDIDPNMSHTSSCDTSFETDVGNFTDLSLFEVEETLFIIMAEKVFPSVSHLENNKDSVNLYFHTAAEVFAASTKLAAVETHSETTWTFPQAMENGQYKLSIHKDFLGSLTQDEKDTEKEKSHFKTPYATPTKNATTRKPLSPVSPTSRSRLFESEKNRDMRKTFEERMSAISPIKPQEENSEENTPIFSAIASLF